MSSGSITPDRPAILLSANSAWNVANFRLGLVRALIAEGYVVLIAAPADGHDARFAAENLSFLPLPIDRSGTNPVSDLKLLRRYSRLMRTVRPAAFLGFTIKPNIYGSLAAHMAGIPVINNVSGLGTMFLGRGWQAKLALNLYWLAMRRSATVFFQNPDDRQLFVEQGAVQARQAQLLPGSGIDLVRFARAPLPNEGSTTFLFIGRLLADKGVREFVSAARMVREQFPDVRFELLGGEDPGNRTAIPTEEIAAWKREGHVSLLGEASDVRPHIARATAVVLPSYREGLPRALLEAAAMGRPMIASDVPGCRTIVSHEHNGLLCAPRDPASLADAVVRMIRMPVAAREEMAATARSTVEEGYSEQRVIDVYLQALRDIGVPSGVGRQ